MVYSIAVSHPEAALSLFVLKLDQQAATKAQILNEFCISYSMMLELL